MTSCGKGSDGRAPRKPTTSRPRPSRKRLRGVCLHVLRSTMSRRRSRSLPRSSANPIGRGAASVGRLWAWAQRPAAGGAVEPAARPSAARPAASTVRRRPIRAATATTTATTMVPRLGSRQPNGATAERLVRRPHPRRRVGAGPTGPAGPRLAPRAVQGHLRTDQPRPGPGRDPASRTRGEDPVGAARALQGRRDGQGRRRQDDGVGQHRLGLRRTAPGRPRGGHRRRHRVRQARQPRRPPGAGLLLGVGRRPAPRDVRRRP